MRFRMKRIPRDGVHPSTQQRLLQFVAYLSEDGETLLLIRIPT